MWHRGCLNDGSTQPPGIGTAHAIATLSRSNILNWQHRAQGASGQQSHNSQMLPEVPSLSLKCASIVSVFCSNYPSGTIAIHTYHSERQKGL